MKSYLDLIPISAKVHKKQTVMIKLCIIFSVFLVAAMFSMADMYIESMKIQTIQSDGAWHAVFKGIDKEQMAIIEARPEVKTVFRYAATNYRLDMGYTVDGVETVLCGFDVEMLELYPEARISEGTFPEKNTGKNIEENTEVDTKENIKENSKEALVSESIKKRLSVSIGDEVTLRTPDGDLTFRISGFIEDTSMMLRAGAYGIFLDTDTYLECFEGATKKEDAELYVEFVPYCRIQDAIKDICMQLGIPDSEVGQNAKLLGLMLQSNNSYILKLYQVAGVLAVLVAFSGMLMILGSLNSNVAQRTEFFGMMRCLGAEKKQIRRFVKREALSWCKTAIPLGLLLSIVVTWLLCGMLKVISPTYFGTMPVFHISLVGLMSGLIIGILTVLLAARSPAKKAAGVSPLKAVSGNAGTVFAVKRAANTHFFHVETSLGVHHATGSKKNLLLLSGSFAFSILLFLGFSTGVDFMQHAITALQPGTPDVSVVSKDNTCSVPKELLYKLEQDEAVKRVYGRSFAYELPAVIDGKERTITLISYEEYQFDWAKDDIEEGSLETVKQGEGVFLVSEPDIAPKAGERMELETALGKQEVTIGGLLKSSPFDDFYRNKRVDTVICSEELFRKLTGETDYTIIDMQLKDKSDKAADRIRETAGDNFTFSDRRKSNEETRGLYYSFALFIYGFLAVVALIAAFNIVNSIAMSVSARMRQYGAMRAIGITLRQLKKMVVAETASYIGCGLVAGLILGFPLHFFLYQEMVTSRWGDAWTVPVKEFCVIMAVILLSAVMAIKGPVRRIREMSIVENISAL